MKRIIITAISVLFFASFAEAKDVVKLLTVGNSFSINSTKYLEDIAKASGCTLIKGTANMPGCSIERHWKYAAAYEADPSSPDGKPYNGRSLREILESDKWDVVTIQQFSFASDNLDSYRPYAKNLYDYIKKYAPQAEVMVHQTWAYRTDDTGKYRDGYSQAAMHEKIRQNYRTIAGELGVRIIPVGEAFASTFNNPDWTFKRDPSFNYDNPVYPAMPNEKRSLWQGFGWSEDKKANVDTHHAGLLGEYLGGAVFFEMLFDKSVIGNGFRPSGATDEDILFLQQVAHATVADKSNTDPVP